MGAQTTAGATIWLTGLPSAGKTTLAFALADRLRAEGHRVEVLDGDELRNALSPELGYSKEDRETNVQRIGYVAEMLSSHGIKSLTAVIAPFAHGRDAVRALHTANGTAFVEIHVATPVELCAERDVKGLYAKRAAGEISGLTGVDDPYEIPADPDLRIQTADRSVADCIEELYAFLVSRNLA